MKAYIEAAAGRIVINTSSSNAYQLYSKAEMKVGLVLLVLHPRLSQSESVSLADILANKAVFLYHDRYADKAESYEIVELEVEGNVGDIRGESGGDRDGRMRLQRVPGQRPSDNLPDECICAIPERCIARDGQ